MNSPAAYAALEHLIAGGVLAGVIFSVGAWLLPGSPDDEADQ
ncbi:hypothetical protein QLQ75_gp33 [Gordonia phage Santhid]|uniref:Uncharacterized protein n=1 Tax=Gordonia phage Santhid TaxID=2927281 RepID=A0AAE9GQ66_9CAUD|nr:hypothetical protein QLQ75_gp33 [Gordonia phage Santhid]UOK18027.1 hypothetical protein SEA_SANTHID_33 [Gordonia phage Santhid]